LPDALLGSAGLPDGFIGLGLLAVLPTVLPVVLPGDVPVEEPTDGELAVPGDVVPEDVPPAPVPPVPAAPPVCANAMVLENASAPANARVMIFMVVFLWLRHHQSGSAVFGSGMPEVLAGFSYRLS
jgi:hypothetical protein